MVQAEQLIDKNLHYSRDIKTIKVQNNIKTSILPSKKYSIIIPALNEEHTIKSLIKTIEKETKKLFSTKDFEILVIDDGSKDLTFNNASEINLAHVHRNEKNMGKGYSMRKGIMHAKGKYIAFIDADGSHNVKDLIRGMKLIESLEANKLNERPFLITGVRFKNGKHGTTILNKAGNKLYSLIGLVLWRQNINDLTCGLRFAKKVDLLNLNLTSSRYTVEVEMIAQCLRKKYTIIQMPINATKRIYGTSGVRAMKEGIILPISFVLSSIKLFSLITKKISI